MSIAQFTGQPVSIEFIGSTVHGVVASGLPLLRATNLFFLASPNTRVRFLDSIVSGNGEETAFESQDSPGALVSIVSSDVVLYGPAALLALSNSGVSVIAKSILHLDPQYVGTETPPTAFSFDVANPALAFVSSNLGPLSGWGDFVADLSDLSGLVLD